MRRSNVVDVYEAKVKSNTLPEKVLDTGNVQAGRQA